MYSLSSDRFADRHHADVPALRWPGCAGPAAGRQRHGENDGAQDAGARKIVGGLDALNCRKTIARREQRTWRSRQGRREPIMGRIRLPAPMKMTSRPPSPLEMPPLACISMTMATMSTSNCVSGLARLRGTHRCRRADRGDDGEHEVARNRCGEQGRLRRRKTAASSPAKNSDQEPAATSRRKTLSVPSTRQVRSGSSIARCSNASVTADVRGTVLSVAVIE